jgi:RimJ/RimL family protein N-acetyltransferase
LTEPLAAGPGMADDAVRDAHPGGEGVRLELRDFTLRPWHVSDVPALHAACQDAEIARWVSIPQPYLERHARAFIEECIAMWRDGTGAAFAIVDPATDDLLGAISRLGPDDRHATLGCWVVPNARGRGIGTGALRAVADWTLESTDTVRLDAYIMVGNQASERMTVRAGFRREGVMRAGERLRGEPVDCVVYARIRGDDVDQEP